MLPVPVIMATTLILVAIGVALAWRQYGAGSVSIIAPVGSWLTRAARRDFYQDDINEALVMRPGQHLTRTLVYTDTAVVDGVVRQTAAGTVGLGQALRKLQNGYVRSYAAMIVAGFVLAALVIHFVRI